jgi:anti-sigma B factor antagonist
MDPVIHASVQRGVPVVSVDGELDLATLPRLFEALARQITDHPGGTLVVDLDAVGVLEPVGLGALVGALGRARARGGDVVLAGSSPRVADALALTRLDRVFASYPSVAVAVAEVAGERAG